MKPKLKPISDQVVVLLGATSGIGLETALHMVEKGARVAIVGRSQEGLNDALEQVRSHAEASWMAMRRGSNGHSQQGQVSDEGGAFGATTTAGTAVTNEMEDQVMGLEADVTNFEQVKSVADQVAQRFGRIDTWVNMAAVSEWALFEDTTPDEFHRIIEVNLLGQAYGAMAALPYIKQQGGGALIFVSSLEGKIPLPYQSAYSASKHGIVGMAETLRQELRHTGVPVSVTTIMPASMNTPLFEKARTKLGVEPAPLPPLYDARMTARAIAYAAEHPVRELIVGDAGHMANFMRRVAPTITSNIMSQNGFRNQRSSEPKSAQAPDNLYHHINGYDQVQGDLDRTVRPFSLITWFATHPKARMALYGGLLAGAGALVGWRVVSMRNERRGWRYKLPHQAKKMYKQAYKASKKAYKTSGKTLSKAGDTVVALPLISALPPFRKRSVFERTGDMLLGWWAAITSLSLPFISRRKSFVQRVSDRIPSMPRMDGIPFISRRKTVVQRISDRLPGMPSMPNMPSMSMPDMRNMPWNQGFKITNKAAKQSDKAMSKVDKQLKKAQKRAEKAMDKVEGRSRQAMKAVSRSIPSKSDIKDMQKRGRVIERRQSVVEKLPFGERRETIVEKMPYK